MSGLFGTSMEDPRTMATLQLAAGLMSAPRFGQGLSSGLLAYGDTLSRAKQQQSIEELRKMQMEQQRMSLEQQRAQAEQSQKDRSIMQQQYNPLAGPTQDGSPVMPRFDARSMLGKGASADAVIQAMNLESALNPKPKRDFKVVGNSLLEIPENGDPRAAFTAPEKATAPPTSIQEYQYAVNQGYKGTFQQYETAMKRAGAASTTVSYGSPMAGVDKDGNQVFFQPSKDGGAPALVPGVRPPPKDPKPATEAQAKADAFRSQMESAEGELSSTPIDMTKLGRQAEVALSGGWTNLGVGPDAQRARQAQEQWAEAFLRFKTGAASTEDEVRRNVRTYFPQPGDSKAVIAQKERQRRQAVEDVGRAGSGGSRKAAAPSAAPKAIKRTGTLNGRKVVQYEDGTTAYAD